MKTKLVAVFLVLIVGVAQAEDKRPAQNELAVAGAIQADAGNSIVVGQSTAAMGLVGAKATKLELLKEGFYSTDATGACNANVHHVSNTKDQILLVPTRRGRACRNAGEINELSREKGAQFVKNDGGDEIRMALDPLNHNTAFALNMQKLIKGTWVTQTVELYRLVDKQGSGILPWGPYYSDNSNFCDVNVYVDAYRDRILLESTDRHRPCKVATLVQYFSRLNQNEYYKNEDGDNWRLKLVFLKQGSVVNSIGLLRQEYVDDKWVTRESNTYGRHPNHFHK